MDKAREAEIVLVAPGDRLQIYQSLGPDLAAVETPVWTGLIATYLKKKGISVVVIDQNAENLTPLETAQRIESINPLLTALVCYGHQPSASTQVMPSAGAVATRIKVMLPKSKVIMVGGHVAALPERTLNEENTDLVCTGEGPYTLWQLVECLRNNSVSPDYKNVQGIMYRDENYLKTTPSAPLVQNLNIEMPAMDYSLLPMGLYRAHNWHCFGDLVRQPYASLYTTLGCPYHCTFCCIQAPFKSGEQALGYKTSVNSYRYWSPKIVADTIGMLVETYGIRNIKFADEMFVLNKHHVMGICDSLIERHYDLNIWAYARIDTAGDQLLLEKMKRAGINWLCFGIESANERVREGVDKGYGEEKIADVIQKVRDIGINVLANFIFGLPEDNYDTMQETFNLALAMNCEFTNFYAAVAYPGSELCLAAKRNGWPLPEKWTGYSHHSVDTLPLPTKYLSGPEVLQFRDYGWNAYFNNPRYHAMLLKKFGQPTVDHIKEVASKKLVRQYVK